MKSKWGEQKLADLAVFKTGKLNSNAAEEDGLYPFFTTAPTTYKINTWAFDQEAVLLGGNNANGVFTLKMYNGRFNAYQRTYVISVNDEAPISNTYLYYALKLQLGILKDISIGSATKFLTKSILGNIVIKYPSNYTEMSNIANCLSLLDSKIELNNQMIATLEELAATLFKQWFVDFEFPDENGNPYKSSGGKMVDSELGEIPEGWKVSDIGSISEKVITGRTPSTKEMDNYGGDVPFITIPDMHGKSIVTTTQRYLSEKGISSGKLLPKESICVSCIATPGLVVMNSVESQTNQQINSIIPKSIDKYILLLDLKSKANLIRDLGSGGSTTLNLNKSQFEKISIIDSVESVKHAFNEIVTPIYLEILKLQLQAETLQKTRDLILPRLLSENNNLYDKR